MSINKNFNKAHFEHFKGNQNLNTTKHKSNKEVTNVFNKKESTKFATEKESSMNI